MIRASVSEVSTLAITLYGLAYAYFTPDLASTLDVNPARCTRSSDIIPNIPDLFLMASPSKLIDISLGIILCSVVAHVLSVYIAWCPELDIYLFSVIVLLNCAPLAL